MTLKRALLLATVVSLPIMISGCTIQVGGGAEAVEPAQAVYVQEPPPTEVVEVIPAHPPGPPCVWQKGHWRWDGHKYYWRHGHWERPPSPRNSWAEPHWEHRNSGYFFVEGHWQ